MTNININQDKASLYKKILNVMGKVERLPKDGYNSFHGYAYTTESAVVDFIRKLMVEEGLVLFNNVREYELNGDIATATIDFTLCDVDTGESVSTCLVGQGQDKGDKAFYKCYAGATKYYLMKTFLVPTGDDPEGDVQTDQNAYGSPFQGKKQQPQGQQGNKQQGNKQQGQGQKRSTNQGNKTITENQLNVINTQVSKIAVLVDQDETDVLSQLKDRIGFDDLQTIPMNTASKCIDLLNKWKRDYSSRIQ